MTINSRALEVRTEERFKGRGNEYKRASAKLRLKLGKMFKRSLLPFGLIRDSRLLLLPLGIGEKGNTVSSFLVHQRVKKGRDVERIEPVARIFPLFATRTRWASSAFV